MKTRQDEIIQEVAEEFGISFSRAKKAWESQNKALGDAIRNHEKDKETGDFLPHSFKTVRFPMIGKFVAPPDYVERLNKRRRRKEEKDGDKK